MIYKDFLNKMDNREPRIDGAITYVPVFNAGKLKLEAKLNTEDYQRLIDSGLTGRWYLNANQRVTVKHGRAYQQVSRLILGIDRTQWVHHKDRDPLNLLRENLEAKRAGRLSNPRATVDKIIGAVD